MSKNIKNTKKIFETKFLWYQEQILLSFFTIFSNRSNLWKSISNFEIKIYTT